MAEPRPPRPPRPDPPSVVYEYTKKITKGDIKEINKELSDHEQRTIAKTFTSQHYKLGKEIAVFTEAGVNRNLVYAETLDGKHHSVFMPKKILQTHFKKEAGHTTEERGTALGKRRKGNRKNKTMRKKSRRHGRKSRKHHRRRH